MDRRAFLLASVSATAALVLGGPALSAENRQRFGIQLFSLPKLLEGDVRKAIAMLAGMGYREVEPYGPYTYSAPEAIARWKAVSSYSASSNRSENVENFSPLASRPSAATSELSRPPDR